MRISLNRQLKVNLGNYESYTFGATVTLDHGDLGYTDTEVQEGVRTEGNEFLDTVVKEAQDKAEDVLDRLLIADITSSREITEEDRSIVLRAFTSQGSDPEPTDRPARRPRRPSRG